MVCSMLDSAAFAGWVDAAGTAYSIMKNDNNSSSSQTTPASDVATSGIMRGIGALASKNDPELKVIYSKTEVDKFRSQCEVLIKDAPTGGKQITFQELENILKPYRKGQGKGNTLYAKTMMGQFEKKDNKWVASSIMNLAITENWTKDTDKKSEILLIKSAMTPQKEGAVESELNNEDASYYYKYKWFKTAPTGFMSKSPKKTAKATPVASDTNKSEQSSTEQYKKPNISVMLYPDATVAGQLCKVYAFVMDSQDKNTPSTPMIYMWFSTVKGFEILQETVMPNSVMAVFTYENKRVDKDSLFFDPEKQSNVTKWAPQK